MANLVLFNIVEDILKNLGSRAIDEISSTLGFKSQLESLKNTMNIIKDVLLDAEERQLQSHAIRGWLERLRDTVYDADDLFDEFATLASQKHFMGGSNFTKEVKTFFSHSNQIKHAFSISHKIKCIKKKIDEIVKDGTEFAFVLRPYEEQRIVYGQGRETYSFVDAEEIIGREDDKKAILKILGQYQDQHVCVVPIVGVGGLGKTTLAQLVYKEVEKLFDLSLWVCVSESFDIKEIVIKILKSATDTEPQNLELDQLHRQLRSQIIGKKYLLVLDDVWNEDSHKWSELSALLKVGREGSKILVTTRLMEVAKIMGTIPDPLNLKGLSHEKSCILFTKMAFASKQVDEDQELRSIGEAIVKKCANVPLAIRTIGSLLRGKDKHEWLNMKEQNLAKIPENENRIFSILKISYHHLKSPLKNCFAYCALFPKDYELKKEALIKLWMAQGFVVPLYENQSLEDTAEEYFLALFHRCFFQDITKDEWGNIRSCKMHDLMHDVASEVAGVGCKVAKFGDMDFDTRICHLSFDYHLILSQKNASNVLYLKGLRTFLLPKQTTFRLIFRKSICDHVLSSYSCLRVLNLNLSGVKALPSSIGELIHLRYLNLSLTPIKAIPDSITKLLNLQTLELYGCLSLNRLPANIGKLTNLRTLDVDRCHDLTLMPSGLRALTSLHSLPILLVNYRTSPTCWCRIVPTAQLRDLNNLNHLRGSLHIKIQGVLKDPACEAKEAKLSSKYGLMELWIEGDEISYDEVNGIEHDEVVLEELKPHSNLRKLKIEWYQGQKLPTWAAMDNLCRTLPNLVEIELLNCERCQQVPIFSQLPYLKRLILEDFDGVEYMEIGMNEKSSSPKETLFFPSLQELTLENMHNLKEWWKRGAGGQVVGDDEKVLPAGLARKSFPNLSKLVIKGCPNLKCMPICPNVENLSLVNVNEVLSVSKIVASPTVGSASTSTSSESSSKLKILCISNVEDLISLPKECLSHLASLKVWYSELQNSSTLEKVSKSLCSLQHLDFSFCDRLQSIFGGLEHLTSLENLGIWDCENLDLSECGEVGNDMQWKALTNLHYLTLHKIPNLRALPSGLQLLTNLHNLNIFHNYELKALPEWIGCFSSLKRMELFSCHKLTCLPEEFYKLTSLKQLTIRGCPRLTKRCHDPNGEDWPKIQHIPFVDIRDGRWD